MKIKLFVDKKETMAKKKKKNWRKILFIFITQCLTISLGVIIIWFLWQPFIKYNKVFCWKILFFLRRCLKIGNGKSYRRNKNYYCCIILKGLFKKNEILSVAQANKQK